MFIHERTARQAEGAPALYGITAYTRMDTKSIVLVLIIFIVKGKVLRAVLLTKSTAEACLREEVVFTCTAEGSSLVWSLAVTSNSDMPVLIHTFFYGDYAFTSNKRMWSQDGFSVKLTLVSVEPVLVSTLAANLTVTLVGAKVTCRQVSPVNQILSGYFSLASKSSV